MEIEVAMVRSRVCEVEMLIFSIRLALRSTRKFSRIRSNTTMVSFSEYPMIASTEASTVRSKVIWKNDRMPMVTITSCTSETMAPTANFHWKRKPT
ncbi:hypothetical protein D9M73_211000 [compost metagenome]